MHRLHFVVCLKFLLPSNHGRVDEMKLSPYDMSCQPGVDTCRNKKLAKNAIIIFAICELDTMDTTP